MADKTRQVTTVFTTKTDGGTDLKTLRQEIEATGDSGVRSAQQIVDGFEGVDKRANSVERAFASGRLASEKNVAAMVVNFQNLQTAVIKAFGSIENAPQVLRDSLKATEDRVTGLRNRFVETENALKDTSKSLNVAGAQWTGFGNMVEQSLGKAGARVGVFATALTSGFSIGSSWAKKLGVDMSELDRYTEAFKERARGVLSVMGDAGWAVMTLNFAELRKHMTALPVAATESESALKGLRLVQESSLNVTKEMLKDAEALALVYDFYATMTSAGADGQKLWNQALAEADGNFATFIANLQAALPELAKTKTKYDELNSAQANRKQLITDEIDGINKLLTTLANERTERELGLTGLNEEMTALQARRQAILDIEKALHGNTAAQQSLNENAQLSIGVLAEQTSAMEPNNAAIGAAINLLKKAVAEGWKPADDQTRQYVETLTGLKGNYTDLDIVEKGRIQIAIQMLAGQQNLTKATGDSQVVYDKATNTMSTLGTTAKEAADKLFDAGKATITSVAGLEAELAKVDSKIETTGIVWKQVLADAKGDVDALTQAVEELGAKADEVAPKMAALAAAGSSGGGGGGGWDDSDTGGFDITGSLNSLNAI